MKRFFNIKTIQLIVFVVIAIATLVIIFTNDSVFHMIATNGSVRVLCIILWITLLLSFVFLYIDFSTITHNRRAMNDLDSAVHQDPSSGIANRYSCDMIIDKYLDQPLPKDIGCVMIEIINISEVNDKYGHIAGNDLIRQFSQMLQIAAAGKCFVGRNGGNRFLALFEHCSQTQIDTFIERMEQQVSKHNSEVGTLQIKYVYGIAYDEDPSEGADTITDLIALSNRRIPRERRTGDRVDNTSNPAGK